MVTLWGSMAAASSVLLVMPGPEIEAVCWVWGALDDMVELRSG